jgi:hypothetical protein
MSAITDPVWQRLGRVAVISALVLVVVAIGPRAAYADPDVTAPDAPTGIFVDEGSSWRAANDFHVWWHTPPGQETPIAVAHYELCPAVPAGPCTTHQAVGNNISEIELALPHAGGFWLRVWLEDSAGNVSSNAKSPQVILRFDDGTPPEAVLNYDDIWLGRSTPVNPSYTVGINANADWPISGIRGYSISLDGSVPDHEVEVFAAQDYERFQATYAIQGLSEGVTVVSIRSISNTGVPSNLVGTAHIRLDRSPPTVFSDALPNTDQWYRKPLSVPIEAHDQADLSGMSPAPLEKLAQEGGHLAYELDDEPTIHIRGAHASVPVTTDGDHRLTFRAFDAAGNGSVEKEVEFKIDGTAPVGSFRALDPRDPRQLRVDVADATSGVEDGRIEYRREGEGRFEPLATTRGDGILSARLDDQSLPAGRYELRAVVTDVAGNEAVIDSWDDGAAAALGMPLRSEARVTVARDLPAAKRCPKAAKTPRGKGKKRQAPVRRKCRRESPSKTSLELAHGKRAGSTGRLTTGQGAPIGGASVVVEGRARSGGAFVPLGTARTDVQGNFRFKIPAGPSRTVRYRYDGTNTVQPAAEQLVTKVRAAARLKASRRRLRNGQAVRFSGRLLGRPIPSAGKLVALQAKVGRRWRTFATPRANAKGVFRHRYRFTATTGMRRYAFRAVVAREAAYPYERGLSRILTVTVKGR